MAIAKIPLANRCILSITALKLLLERIYYVQAHDLNKR